MMLNVFDFVFLKFNFHFSMLSGRIPSYKDESGAVSQSFVFISLLEPKRFYKNCVGSDFGII